MQICKICRHQGRTRCIICGWKPHKRKKALTLLEQAEAEGIKNEYEFLATLFNRLKKFNMESTGSIQVDMKVHEKFGDWLAPDARYIKRENGDVF